MIDYKAIKLIVMDVDGTLTDGTVYIGAEGETAKKFNIKDGLAINLLGKHGIDFMILTGRKSESVTCRAKELNIRHVNPGITNKLEFLKEFMEKHHFASKNIAYIGDDLNDYQVMKFVGFGAAPADAVKEIKDIADYVSKEKGGHGAVREILEYIMSERNEWNNIIKDAYGVQEGK